MPNQSWVLTHAETITQNVVGLVIGYIILKCFGLSNTESLHLQAIFFIASYTRGYFIRRIFSGIGNKQ